MRRFPETIATKQDVENILNHHPEYHTHLKIHLQRAYEEPDEIRVVTSYDFDPVTGEMINVVTKKVKRDKMKYKDLGFKDKNTLKNTINMLSITK